MSNKIDAIVASITEAKTAIKEAAAAAAETAPKGKKMPYRQHAQFEASSAVAEAAVEECTGLGYTPAAARFAKPKKDGTVDLIVTYRIPVTLETRLQRHAEAAKRRKAAIAARKAAKTKETAKEESSKVVSIGDRISAALGRKAA